jgi:tetraacyldisaccharide 4'-kinase
MRRDDASARRRTLQSLWRPNLSALEQIAWIGLALCSVLYLAAVAVRGFFWKAFARKAKSIRVISVGNLTVGGNGKTPFTLYLARTMRERGIAVAIVSRGYGGSNVAAAIVSDGKSLALNAEQAGDEPVMMARSFSGPIAIGRKRADALNLLERFEDLRAAILDDGFQHLRLRRDVDLLIVSAERGLGNGWTLPAGPMRERLRAIRRVDGIVLLTSRPNRGAISASQLGELAERPIFRGRLVATALVEPGAEGWRERPLALAHRRVLAVSGIADPSRFYGMLRDLEADLVGVLEYPDHHRYSNSDWQRIAAAARDADVIITTEKDLTKLERFPFAHDSLYALRLVVVMGEDEERLLALVAGEAIPSGRGAGPNQCRVGG